MKKYRIDKSKIHRKGIILVRDIKKDEAIFRFDGKSIKNNLDWYHGSNWLQVGYSEWIIPAPGSVGNYLNHSCSPNAGVRGRNTIVAMRDLKSGEEVVIDYALSETYPLWHMRCTCGNKNCRKLVKPYQDLSPQRQKKYVEYTSRYILDMKMHLNWQEYLHLKQSSKTKPK
jgi:uncharacterized protein